MIEWNESKAWTAVAGFVTVITLGVVLVSPGCNRSDNELKAKLIEAGCTYISGGHIVCQNRAAQ